MNQGLDMFDSWKNQRSKISWDYPFNESFRLKYLMQKYIRSAWEHAFLVSKFLNISIKIYSDIKNNKNVH
jgi:hypothetical protein